MSSNLRQRKQPSFFEPGLQNTAVHTTPNTSQTKWSEFVTRSVWGSVMIGLFALICTNHLLACLMVILLQIVVFKEMISLRYIEAKEKNLWGFRTLHWYFLFVTLYWLYGSSVLMQLSQVLGNGVLDSMTRYHLASAFSFYVIGFVAFVLTLKKEMYKYQFGQLAWTVMTLLLVVGQSHFIIQNIFKGLFWLVLPASLIVCNDITAYFCGITLGRRFTKQTFIDLSPNKTWEGFVGALLCTCVLSFFLASVLAQFPWLICPYQFNALASPCTPSTLFLPHQYQIPQALAALGFSNSVTLLPVQLHAVVFALFASLIAPFGGFFASGMKRAYGIKEFDSLVPGHGGMTDRMDCQFIMGLFTYVYCTALLEATVIPTDNIVQLISQLPIEDQLTIFSKLSNTLVSSA